MAFFNQNYNIPVYNGFFFINIGHGKERHLSKESDGSRKGIRIIGM